jgi:cell division septal protein FtsQ
MAGIPTQRNPKNRTGLEENSFRPHQRYPRLNANAGKDEIAPRGRRPARRNAVALPTRREATPRASIRLDSAFEASATPVRRPARPRTGARRARSQGLSISVNPARLVSLAAMLVLLGLGYWFLNSPGFYISKVEVTGNRLLNSDEVIKITGVDKINVFGLNEEEVAAKIKTLPYILQASVKKALPDKLAVTVTERHSILNWKVGGYSYLVDPEGVVLDSYFEKDLPEEAKAYPVIESLDDRKMQLGDRVDAVAVRSAQAIQAQLATAGFKVAAVQYSPSSGLVVISAPPSGTWKALLGTDAQLDQKINILKALLADKNIKWSFADLRFVNKPAIQ